MTICLIRRREIISLLLGAAAWPYAAQAQKKYHIGLLSTGSSDPLTDLLISTLRELGYIEGKNTVIERRFVEGNLDRLHDLAAELVKLRIDVIVTVGTPAGLAAKRATSTIPIVIAASSDPVGVGLVASLNRPGGNATGLSLMAPDLSAKRLEILRALSPQISRVAILWDSSNPGMAARVRETEIAADQSHLVLRSVGPRNLAELDAAFVELANLRPDALLVTTEPFTLRHMARIVDFANKNRIPAMFEESTFVESGGLMSYGPNLRDVFRRAATYVDKILKGAKPADLPVEQPTKFDLVINLKTARALDLAIPSPLQDRADKLIE
ncbi:MAG: ABC transporter substrate-binding protein [Lysobacterales bacterium]